MAIKLKHSNTSSTWFITFTCVEWIPLIEMTNTYDMVYKWFDILKNEYKSDVVAYVIMPNHLHVILHFHSEDFDLNKIIANGKRFIAYEIVNLLEIARNTTMLGRLKNLITEREKIKGQLHKIFKGPLDAKAIFTQPFLL